MPEQLSIDTWRLIASYLFLFLLLLMSSKLRLGRGRDFIVATVRMTIQLVLAGYLLDLVFGQNNPLVTLLILFFMQGFAIYTIISRLKGVISDRLKKIVVAAIFIGTSIPLAYFMLIVIAAEPWYEPRYFIPIAGMTVGNSMTGISLGAERLSQALKSGRAKIEEALMLGATPQMAVSDILSETFSAAIIPTMNSMLGMGLVFIPGMMTGQILAGSSAVEAIKYQIVIMMGITGSVSLAVFLLINLGYRTFFNDRDQLIIEQE